MTFHFAPLEVGAYDFAKIDPAWPWVSRTVMGYRKSPKYKKKMTWAEIEALPVRDLLKSNGVIWLWCTWPLIGRQAQIAENCWGLKVATGGAWAKRTRTGKLRPGTGFIFRSVCEPFLICTLKGHRLRARGAAYNLIETIDEMMLDGVAREHSRKPEEAYNLIESLTPGWKRADVYARQRRVGWDGYGDELNKFKPRHILKSAA